MQEALQQQQIESIIQSSYEVHSKMYLPIINQLNLLKYFSQDIAKCFQQFKQSIFCMMNQAMGKITCVLYREIQAKRKLQEQLFTVQDNNNKIRNEVVQLRKMIYQEFFQEGNKENHSMKQQAGRIIYEFINNNQDDHNSLRERTSEKNQQGIVYEPTVNTEKQEQNDTELYVIQQVSEQARSIVSSAYVSSRQLARLASDSSSRIQNSTNSGVCGETELEQYSGSNNKIKSFLDFFRSKVDESNHQNFEDIENVISHQSSVDNLPLGDTDKINIPKSIKSPKAMQFLKKKNSQIDICKDSNKSHSSCEGLIRSSHFTGTHRRIKSEHETDQPKVIWSGQKNSRSHSKNNSKQKIKLSTKIRQENQHFAKNNRKASKIRPLVHLGGKNHTKKLIKDIKASLQSLKIWQVDRSRQVTYKGERKNGTRWGKGTLLFDNGFVYQGSFVQNYRHGSGTISINGIQLYQGQWCLDELNGQGYIKSLKNFSLYCPKALSESSFSGQFMQNTFHGMGTLFINQYQKIVTKFIHGVPVGQYTYYNYSDIEFGTWF